MSLGPWDPKLIWEDVIYTSNTPSISCTYFKRRECFELTSHTEDFGLGKKHFSNVFSNWVSWLWVHFYFWANYSFKKKEICRILWLPLPQNWKTFRFGKWEPRIRANENSALENVQHQRKKKYLTIFNAACNHHFWIPTFEAARALTWVSREKSC